MRVSPWLRYHTQVHHTLTDALEAVAKMKPASVYLCGGINGLSDSACKDWRATSAGRLAPVRMIDPMIRDYRGREDECVNEIVELDKRDVLEADVILVNASRPSWGTAMEIMFAWSLQKPIVSFMEIA